MDTFYINGKDLAYELHEQIEDRNSIDEIEFNTTKIDEDYINKYRLIYGKEYNGIEIRRLSKSKVLVLCGSNDNKIHLYGNLAYKDEIRDELYGIFTEFEYLKKLDLSLFDTERVENMRCLFGGCTGLREVHFGNWDTSNVKSFRCMFLECHELKKVDFTNFNTSKAEDIAYMFCGCWFLNEIDLSSFNTCNVKDMSGMFQSCLGLNKVDLSTFKTDNVVDMEYMFHNCIKIESINMHSISTPKLKEINMMFYGCKELKYLDLGNFSLSALDLDYYGKKASNMFYGCNISNIITKDDDVIDIYNNTHWM